MDSGAAKRPVSRRTSLGQLAYERIKGDILDERLLPRQPLIEAELAGRYGMSKTPVREALLSLAREGLVEMSSFRGGRVRDFTAEDARDIYEVRELLEPFALRLAVPRMTEGDRRSLRALLADARVAAEDGDRRELSRLNGAFHGSLLARCGNKRAIEILAHLQNQVRVMSLRMWNVRATHFREAAQHAEILTAVEAGRAEGAARLLGEHLAEFKERYVREWEV